MNTRMNSGFRGLVLIFISFPFILNAQSDRLFDVDDILELTISGDIGGLMKDRGNDPQYHSLTLSYKNADSPVSIPVKIKARGHFRKAKENCTYPPLLLNFSRDSTQNSVFEGQDKLKLVTPCRGDKYVVREYLVYKLYNQITPRSFKVRLVKVTYNDSGSKSKKIEPLYGMLIEDEDQMAKRNNTISVVGKLVRPEQTQKEDFLNLAVFEYMIGNTDWSVQYLQNVKLIATDSLAIPSTVPYDFDHAGIVDAPYALPAAELQMTSTRERRYRGYCIRDMNQFTDVIGQFNQRKDDFYNVYTSSKILEENYLKSTIKFLDDFYKTINDPKRLKNEFQYPCNPDGTGNVVIQGLKKN
ncbi:MAG: hypothetical protein ABL895_15490 [Cyclobacteriaceae bacterium]